MYCRELIIRNGKPRRKVEGYDVLIGKETRRFSTHPRKHKT